MSSIAELGGIPTQPTTTQGQQDPNQLVSSTQFLELLVAQIENQNPLEPLDGTEWATQLAEFANLEQLTQVNSGIKTVDSGIAAQISQQALQYIDRQVTYEGDTVVLGDDGSADLTYSLGGSADEMVIRVYDKAGFEVGQVVDAPRAAGINTWTWDGTVQTASGEKKLDPGSYRIEVEATADGQALQTGSFGTAVIDGVAFLNDGSSILLAGDERIPLGKILSVGK